MVSAIRIPVGLLPPSAENYGDESEETRSKFVPEIGYARTRQRYRTTPRLFNVLWELTTVQYHLLKSFYYEGIDQGAREFDIELIDGDEIALAWFTVNWINQFDADGYRGDRWRVQAILRSVKPSFATRPSGTDELISVSDVRAFNSGNLLIVKTLHGINDAQAENFATLVQGPMYGISDVEAFNIGKFVYPSLLYGAQDVEIINTVVFDEGDPAAASLQAAMVSWWDFEENDGAAQFNDSCGSNHLAIRTGAASTASSVVSTYGLRDFGFAPGGFADRVAYIPRSNTALDLPNSSWSFGGWFRGGLTAGGWTGLLMGRLKSLGIQAYLAVEDATSGTPRFRFSASTDGSTETHAFSGVTLDAEVYSLVICTLDRPNNLIRIRVKRTGGVDVNVTAAFAGALYTGSTNANFAINDSLSNDSAFFSGERHLTGADCGIDACFFVSKAVTDDEATYLFNAGRGLNYAALVAGTSPGYTQPSSPTTDAHIADVVLLADASNYANGSTPAGLDVKGKTPTYAGNAAITTGDKVFGSSCLYFDGNGDFVSFADSADWAMGSGPCTYEAWIKPSASNERYFLSQATALGAFYSILLGRKSSGAPFFRFSSGAASNTILDGAGQQLPTRWMHVGACRDASNVWRAFASGIILNTVTLTDTMMDSTGPMVIGAYGPDTGSTYVWSGHVDQVRITKGVCRYTGSYLVPTAPFPHS